MWKDSEKSMWMGMPLTRWPLKEGDQIGGGQLRESFLDIQGTP